MSDLHIIGPEAADCAGCSLREQKEAGRCVPARPPAKGWEPGGLMIIGDAPRSRDLTAGRPFAGRHGQLMDALFEAADLDRDRVFMSNALLCQPAILRGTKEPLHKRHPDAVPSCLARLEAEIAMYRPRVIVTMGDVGLWTAAGFTRKKRRLVDNPCSVCDPKTRKVGPVLECATGDCDWVYYFEVPLELENAAKEGGKGSEAHALLQDWLKRRRGLVVEEHDKKCPRCSARITRLRPKRMKCRACGGKKKRQELYEEWDCDYTLKETAGGVFQTEDLPSRWQELGVRYVIPTFTPSYLLMRVDTGSTRKVFGGQFAANPVVDHLTKAKILLRRDINFDFEVLLTDDPADIYDYCKEPGIYEWDVETNAKSAWDVTDLRCIGVGQADRKVVLVIDTRGMIENVGDETLHRFEVQKHQLAAACRWMLTEPHIAKVAQNGPYDNTVCYRLLGGTVVAPIAGDTKNAHHVLRPDEPHELQTMAFEMTEALHWKPPKKVGGVLKHDGFVDLAIYNARDVRATSLTHRAIAGPPTQWDPVTHAPPMKRQPTGVLVPQWTTGGLLANEGLRDVYDVDIEVGRYAMAMERTGVPIDTGALRDMIADVTPKRDALLAELEELSGLSGFNPNSPKQLQYVLFHKQGPCKLQPTARTPTGDPSTAAVELAKLSDHLFVQKLLKFRGYDKALGTYIYGKGMVPREDGRIHPQWNTTGARTGRWSSSPNFQNWPEWLRAIVRPPGGWRILGADYSQLELRIVAALSGDKELIRRCMTADEADKLNPERDPHSFVASIIFGAAFLEAGKAGRKTLRSIVKACIYGMNYGAGPKTVRESIYANGYDGPPLGIQQVANVIEQIFTIFPGVKAWRDDALKRATRNGEVRSAILNRWRTFPLGDVDATVAWNYPIQSTGADIIGLRLIALGNRLAKMGSRAQFMAQVHDAVYLLVPEEEEPEVAQAMNEELSVDLVLVEGAPAMHFAATAHGGDDWAQVA